MCYFSSGCIKYINTSIFVIQVVIYLSVYLWKQVTSQTVFEKIQKRRWSWTFRHEEIPVIVNENLVSAFSFHVLTQAQYKMLSKRFFSSFQHSRWISTFIWTYPDLRIRSRKHFQVIFLAISLSFQFILNKVLKKISEECRGRIKR